MEARKEVYGEIDEQHPLIIMTAYVPDFKHKSIDAVLEHKSQLEAVSRQPFTYVCITDAISTDDAASCGLDCIPFSSIRVRSNRQLWLTEARRRDIQLPKSAIVKWIDMDAPVPKTLDFSRD